MSNLFEPLFSIPDRIFLKLRRPTPSQLQEGLVWESCGDIWITSGQLHTCQERYQTDYFFLDVLERVYGPLLSTGRYAPLSIIVYLSVGYTLRSLAIPSDLAHRNRKLVSGVDIMEVLRSLVPGPTKKKLQNGKSLPIQPYVSNLIKALNLWLAESLHFDFTAAFSADELRRFELQRANWPALYSFVRRALSLREIGVTGYPSLDPGVCETNKVREFLAPLERDLAIGRITSHNRAWQKENASYFENMEQAIRLRLRPPASARSETEEMRRLVWVQQTRAVNYYLNRGGVLTSPSEMDEQLFNQQLAKDPLASAFAGEARQHLLDFHALAGYQAFGQFLPDERTTMLIEHLSRRLLDITLTQRTRENTVDGISRRGSLSQMLKYQLALGGQPVEKHQEGASPSRLLLYDRYLNHNLLYLRQVSQRSQEMALTLLFVVDIGPDSHVQTGQGSRKHSLEREVCAHLIQDCYQMLWRIPRLFAETVVVQHSGAQILWRSNMLLSDGSQSQPLAEDIFLKSLPEWLLRQPGYADPPTFFQFALPALMEKRQNEKDESHGVYRPDTLASNLADTVHTIRQERLAWMRGKQTSRTGGVGLLPISDLFITVLLPSKPLEAQEALKCSDALHGQGLLHQTWVCECSDSIQLRQPETTKPDRPVFYSLADFQRQHPMPGVNPPRSLRQIFVYELLRSIQALCDDSE